MRPLESLTLECYMYSSASLVRASVVRGTSIVVRGFFFLLPL